MAGVYRPRHPERTVLYRVLFHHFERFVAEYEDLVVASWAYYSNRGKGDIGGVARRLIWKCCFLTKIIWAKGDIKNGVLGLAGASWAPSGASLRQG
jgi:hypothetical protein